VDWGNNMKKRRRLLILLIVLFLFGVVVFEGGRRLLASQYVANKVASKLTEACGAPVSLAAVDLGFRNSSVNGLRLYEAGDQPGAANTEPWVSVNEVTTDVTLWGAIRGVAVPSQITLRGATIHLRFDKAGRLLTKLPKQTGESSALPKVRVADSQLIIDQEGKPPLSLTGISGDLQADGTTLLVGGTVVDPIWGDWMLDAHWDKTKAMGQAALRCARSHLVQKRLDGFPFIPASIWREVTGIEGDTAVAFELFTRDTDNAVHYRVSLTPIGTTVYIPSIDLGGDLTGGTVIVEDNLVKLQEVKARTTDGTLTISGELDFRGARETRMEFTIDAQKLAVAKLPTKWGFPGGITGNLSGHAQLDLRIVGGQVQSDGTGQATITEAQVEGLPAHPIDLKLHPAGKGFRFGMARRVAGAAGLPTGLLPLVIAEETQQPESLRWVTAFPDRLLRGMTAVFDKLMSSGQTVTRMMRGMWTKPDPKMAPLEQQGYLEIQLGLDDVDLEQLLQKLQVKLPFSVRGKVSFNLNAQLPTDTPRDFRAYRLKGSASFVWFTLEGLRLEKVEAQIDYSKGVLELRKLTGAVPGGPGVAAGSFSGDARLELFPPGHLTAKVSLERLPVARLAILVPGAADKVSGVLTGKGSVGAPADHLGEIKTWAADTTLESEHLEVFGLKLEGLSARMSLGQGRFNVADLKAIFEGGPVSGSAGLTLMAPYEYKGTLDLHDVDLGMVQRLSPGLRPPLAVAGRLGLEIQANGTLSPFAARARGKVDAKDLKVEKVSVSGVSFGWEGDEKRLKLTDLRAVLYKGEIAGQATIPLQPGEAGSIEADLKKIDLGALAASLPVLPVRLEGRASGTLKATIPAAKPRGDREWTSDLTVRSTELKVQGVPADSTRGTMSYKNGVVDYHLQGITLGGTFHIDGKLPIRKATPAPPALPAPPHGAAAAFAAPMVLAAAPLQEGEGSLRFDDLQLGRIWEWLGVEQTLRPLNANLNLQATYRHGPNGQPSGTGSFSISDLRWGERRLAGQEIMGRVRLQQRELRLTLSTSRFGGLVRALAVLDLHQPKNSWFDVTLSGLSLSQLLEPWPDFSNEIRGALDVQLRGQLGEEWSGSGAIGLSGASLYGLEFSSWHAPVTLSYLPVSGQGQLTFHDSAIQFLTGRGTGQATLSWGGETRLEGRMHFFGVEIQHLFQHSSAIGRLGSGRLSGDLDFGGHPLRSFDDLTATLNAKLEQTQALQFPVLRQLVPFLFLNLSSATTFQEGGLRARLARSVVRIESLTLQAPVARLHLEGTATVPDGRLNMEVAASTGNVPRLGLCGPASNLALIVIYLHVGGNVHTPAIQVQPFRILTEPVGRFLRF
jgi:hypothetical protein